MTTALENKPTDLKPDALYHMAMGFAITKTLLSAHALGIFQSLEEGEKTAATVARERSLQERAVEMLMNACVSVQLLQKTEDRFSNAPLVSRYLIPGRTGYLGRFFEHFNDHMYPAWQHLEESVRTGHAQIQRVVGEQKDHFFQAIDRDQKDLETFMETMEEHSLLEGGALAQAYDFSAHQELLDVGGGTGAMSVSIVKQHPHLKATVYDRPPVCKIAEKNIASHGASDKVRAVPGDFFKGPLPRTADIVLLSGILHNWSRSNAEAILRQCAQVLPTGGILLISEQILNTAKTEPVGATLCSLNMLIMMEGAQEYSREEYASFLSSSGFVLEEVRPTQGIRQLIIARRTNTPVPL